METNKATSASSFTGEEMEFGEFQWLAQGHRVNGSENSKLGL